MQSAFTQGKISVVAAAAWLREADDFYAAERSLGLVPPLSGRLSPRLLGFGEDGSGDWNDEASFCRGCSLPTSLFQNKVSCLCLQKADPRSHLRNCLSWPKPCHLMSINSTFFPPQETKLFGQGGKRFKIHIYHYFIQQVLTACALFARCSRGG